MFGTFLLSASMIAGQAPPPLPLPATPQTPPAVMAPAVPMTADVPTYSLPETPKEEEKPPPTKYAVQTLLEDRFLGQRYKDSGINIYGWTEMSFTGSSARRSNLPTTFNDRANQFQLNQNYVIVEKHVDTTKKEFQLGFETDFILPGTDARFTVVRGLFDNQLSNGPNGGTRAYPIDIYQGFIEAFLPNVGPQGTTVKMGRFATHCSYEVVQGTQVPFLSRSYGFQYNPFTHTGVWAITPLNDDWTISNGMATGSDTFIDPANRPTYIGSLKYAPKDGKDTVLFNTVITNPKYDTKEAFAFYNVYNLQWIHKFNDKLTYVLDSTFSNIKNAPNIGSTNWYGAVNYLLWQHSDKLTSNFRAELFEDTDGFRTGSKGLYQEYTYGVTYSPVNWLLIRPFARYDHNSTSAPFEGKKNLYTGGLDMIVRW